MHGGDHRAGMLRRYGGMNAVTEIENMAMAVTITRQHASHFFANVFG